jgi:hypothetical protein
MCVLLKVKSWGAEILYPDKEMHVMTHIDDKQGAMHIYHSFLFVVGVHLYS